MNPKPKLLLLAALLIPGLALAGTDSEREALARLAGEIQALDGLVAEAEAQSPGTQRIAFQYAWLRRDLERVRAGILDHLNAPPGEPRTFEPLRGDYRR